MFEAFSVAKGKIVNIKNEFDAKDSSAIKILADKLSSTSRSSDVEMMEIFKQIIQNPATVQALIDIGLFKKSDIPQNLIQK